MKNLIKFLLFVLLVSGGISLLYDYRIRTGGLKFLAVTSEKYSLATNSSVDPKEVPGLEALNRERRALVGTVFRGCEYQDLEEGRGQAAIPTGPIRLFQSQPTPVPEPE